MAIEQLNSAVVTLTQGSADAFVQGSILTNLSGSGQAWKVRQVWREISSVSTGFPGADCEFSVAITRRSKAAMPLISDTDVVWKDQHVFGVTTSGATDFDGVIIDNFDDPGIIMPEDTIYAQLDSTGTGGAVTAILRINYEIVKISELDRLTILAGSLTNA